ncbi:MAG: LysM peptidoglycan-binding domain-containing protein [Caldilineaceae bacterium]|nr:LysM peptidoglycan-binding domain-containing protein [Caldilineaceae bacterium]
MRFTTIGNEAIRCLSATMQFRYTVRFLLISAFVFGSLGLAPASVVRANSGIHIVAPGESLGTIARSYNISVRELISNNGLSNPDVIVVGQRLEIPGLESEQGQELASRTISSTKELPYGDGYYTVQRGDTLSQIARSNGMELADMLRLNGLTNANFLGVGQKLRVTARVAPVATDEELEPKLASKIYIVKQGDTLAKIASANNMTLQQLLSANGLPHENFTWAGQRLRIYFAPRPTGVDSNFDKAPADGYRWIEVNLSNQTLTAWQGDVAVLHTYISSGVTATPTVTGRFRIGTKLTSQRMIGPGYDLPGVPWVMYFYGSYAIHGAYWHNNFGMPMSHGCVNMRTEEAQFLFNWAPVGTEVYVHY